MKFTKLYSLGKYNVFYLLSFVLKIIAFRFGTKMYGLGRRVSGYHDEIVTYGVAENLIVLLVTLTIPLFFEHKCRFHFLRIIVWCLVLFCGILEGWLVFLEFLPLFDLVQYLEKYDESKKEVQDPPVKPIPYRSRSLFARLSLKGKDWLVGVANTQPSEEKEKRHRGNESIASKRQRIHKNVQGSPHPKSKGSSANSQIGGKNARETVIIDLIKGRNN